MHQIAIIAYSITAAVWILSMLRNVFYRRLGNRMRESRTLTPVDDSSLPPLSVVVTTHNQADQLRRLLPMLQAQIYPNFEVIVVDMNSTDETKALLESLEEDDMRLRHTFTPSTSRDISLQRLAITLGFKAATNDWVVLTQADCCPISHQWLHRMGEAIASHRSAQMAVGYTRFDNARDYTERRMRFFRLWQEMLTLDFARQHGVYRCDGTNLAYRKDLFISHQGFASHSSLLMGATDIMVNQNSTVHNTALCLHPEATMQQKMLSHKHWKQDRRFFQETRSHFTNRFRYRFRYLLSVLLHILLVASMFLTLALAIYFEDYVVVAVADVLWLVHLVWQGVCFNSSAKVLEDKGFNILSIAWYIHCIPFWDLSARVHYLFSDKRQYRKKYI